MELSFAIDGVVRTIAVTAGQEVVAGSVLAVLDGADAEEAVFVARQALEEAEREAREIRERHLRLVQKIETGAAVDADARQSEADVVAALSAREEARGAYAAAQQRRHRHTLYAHVEGRVESISVRSNEVVQAGDAVAILRPNPGTN